VELFATIRRDARVEECSIRELAGRYHVHRRAVRQALASAIPPPRMTPAKASPRLEPFKAAVAGMLLSDLDAPRKHRHKWAILRGITVGMRQRLGLAATLEFTDGRLPPSSYRENRDGGYGRRAAGPERPG
jgi:hypothetical protein